MILTSGHALPVPTAPQGAAQNLCAIWQEAKFITVGIEARVKPVAFERLKADEPREAKQLEPSSCFRIGRGKSGRTDPHV